jgi:hypothetical protein
MAGKTKEWTISDEDIKMHYLEATPENVWLHRRTLRWRNSEGRVVPLCECSNNYLFSIKKSGQPITNLCLSVIDRIMVERVERPARVALRIPFEELPLHINEKNRTIRHVVLQRLKRAR